MSIKFPGELDNLQSITSTPASTPLSSAGDGSRAHDLHHADLGAAVVSLQSIVISHDHDHSGDTSSTNKPGLHKGVKLKQVNTHQDPDTDKSATSLHHTLGNGATQAAPGKATADAISHLNTKISEIEALLGFAPLRIFTSLSTLVSWQATATIQEYNSVVPTLGYVQQTNKFYVMKKGSPNTEVDFGPPAGTISMFAGNTAPTGYLLCDGQAYDKVTYAKLYSVIGTTYGGSGSLFNVPDLRGRAIFGVDTGDTDFNASGVTGGSKTHNHTEGNLAAAIGAVDDTVKSLGYLAGQKTPRGPNMCYSYSLWFPAATSFKSTPYYFNHHTPVFGHTASTKTLPPYLSMNHIIKY